jgi:hypothetical protein
MPPSFDLKDYSRRQQLIRREHKSLRGLQKMHVDVVTDTYTRAEQ